MKYAIILAAGIPVAVFLLLTVAVICITCIIASYKRKNAEYQHKQYILDNKVEAIRMASKNPDPKFLEFAERIILGCCSVCSEQDGDVKEEEEKGKKKRRKWKKGKKEEEDSKQTLKPEEVESKVVNTMCTVLESCLDNDSKVRTRLGSAVQDILVGKGIVLPAEPTVMFAVNPMATTGQTAGVGEVPSISPTSSISM
jgi:hypothetical protein